MGEVSGLQERPDDKDDLTGVAEDAIKKTNEQFKEILPKTAANKVSQKHSDPLSGAAESAINQVNGDFQNLLKQQEANKPLPIDAAESAIAGMEEGLRERREIQEKNKIAYQELVKRLGEANYKQEDSWLPDKESTGEVFDALQGRKPRMLNASDLGLKGSNFALYLNTKKPFGKHDVIPGNGETFVCVEKPVLTMLEKGRPPKRSAKLYILGKDGNTRIVQVEKDDRQSIPKVTYKDMNETIPKNFWNEAVRLSEKKPGIIGKMKSLFKR